MESGNFPILLVDDEVEFLENAQMILQSAGFADVSITPSSAEAKEMLKKRNFSLVALDVTLPEISGVDLLEHISAEHPGVTVIMITASIEIKTAVECMRKGAYDYLVKPLNYDSLTGAFRKAISYNLMKQELSTLKSYILDQGLKHPEAFSNIITQDSKMQAIFCYSEAIVNSKLPVLISGETGTGKELMAKAIHNLVNPTKPFIPVNVAGLDDNVFSDTLFGHRKGAFTGAADTRKGLLCEAGKGTIFLDEIGDLKPESQVKLLRLIQEGEYYPLGSDTPKYSVARIIAATNHNISSSDLFRKDLYYRLQTHHINLPPLRERVEDIPLLVDYFAHQAFKTLNKPPFDIPATVGNVLKSYHFAGNIRELESLIFEFVVLSSKDQINYEFLQKKTNLDFSTASGHANGRATWDSVSFGTHLPTYKEIGTLLIQEALKRSDGNRTHAAKVLQISRQTLLNKLSN